MGKERRTLLILGSKGQVATDLAALLREAERPFVSVGREATQWDLLREGEAERLLDDLCPAAVVNAAAYTAVDKAEIEREHAFALNAAMPGRFARACAKAGIPFVHYSTDYVFDGTKAGPWVETDPTNPLSAYGESKLAGEREVLSAGGKGVVLRTTWVYGRHGHNFLKTMVRLAREKEELRVVADQRGAPTSSLAIARATVRLLDAPVPGLFHFSAGGETTWHGFASRIVEGVRSRTAIPCQAVTPIATHAYPLPAKRPANSVLANVKFQDTYGFRLPTWEAQFEETFEDLLVDLGLCG